MHIYYIYIKYHVFSNTKIKYTQAMYTLQDFEKDNLHCSNEWPKLQLLNIIITQHSDCLKYLFYGCWIFSKLLSTEVRFIIYLLIF